MSFHHRNNRAAKLTAIQVVEIRKAYATGESQASLCRRYQMSIGQIGRIVRGEAWPDAGGGARATTQQLDIMNARALVELDNLPGNQLIMTDDEAAASAARVMALVEERKDVPQNPVDYVALMNEQLRKSRGVKDDDPKESK